MSYLAASNSTADCPEQSASRPSHTFKKTTAINAIIANVPDNSFCHLVAFRISARTDFKEETFDIWSETKPNWLGFTLAPCLITQMGPLGVGLNFFR
jgi:hypothetical protein